MSTPDTSTLAGKIAVMQAALDGKPIEHRSLVYRSEVWNSAPPKWNWGEYDYRIKPTEPQETWTPTGRRKYVKQVLLSRRDLRAEAGSIWMACAEGTPEWFREHVEERSESGATRWVPVPVEE